ncbi:hypothetical protein [Streptomyces sp. NPDC001568]|uniref:hypothetical protein n=1 Tax=Streptomyces sp. NPDC001568 TaxID=3364588 RepID=UPI0036B5B2A9
MDTSDQGGDSMGAESGREPTQRREEPGSARPRRTVRMIAGQLAREATREATGVVVEAAVGAWAPEWVEVVRVLALAVPAAARLRRRGRRRA